MNTIIDLFKSDAFDERTVSAYTFTNENLRWDLSQIPTQDFKSVLTVAASGDQALFYKLYGATTIHTYDIRHLAGTMQELKTTAIQHLIYDEYMAMMAKIKNKDITQIPHIDKCIPKLSPLNQELIKITIQQGRFTCNGGTVDSPYNINRAEYEKLQSVITGPFDFKQCDIANLDAKFNNKYDLIDTSNIFDYLDNDKQTYLTIATLAKLLKVGGKIVIHPQKYNINRYKKIQAIQPQTKTPYIAQPMEFRQNNLANASTIILMQRTR